METNLTSTIKKRLRDFRPALKSNMRTIRWAEEVQTATGYVDVIRFEDYIIRDDSYCALITPTERGDKIMFEGSPRECKIKDSTFPCVHCHGCVCKRNVHILGVLTTCYEVKITLSDFNSNHGHNFHGNRNYYVVPSEICAKVISKVPRDIGVIAYYKKRGYMAIRRESEHRDIEADALNYLLYSALKKWVDGRQETAQVK